MEKNDKQPRIPRYVEYLVMALAAGSLIWMTVTASASKNPVGDPQLFTAIVVSIFFVTLYGAVLVIKEMKTFGLLQAIISLFSFVVVQLLCWLGLRLIGL